MACCRCHEPPMPLVFDTFLGYAIREWVSVLRECRMRGVPPSELMEYLMRLERTLKVSA